MIKKYCPECLVEIEDRLRHCPLCDAELQNDQPKAHGQFPSSMPRDEEAATLSKGVKRAWALLAMTICGLLIMMICTIVDLNTNRQMGWSVLVNVSILSLILILPLIFYLTRRPVALFTGIWLVATALTVAIDAASLPISWSLSVALPIAGWVLLFFGGWLLITVRSRSRFVTSIVSLLIAVAGFCVALDITLNPNPDNPRLFWSIPVLVSLSVAAAGLFTTDKVLKKNDQWKRLFER